MVDLGALLLGVILLAVQGTTLASNQWYVSSAGDDSWSGTLIDANAARTDGPVATVARAAELVRSRRDRATASVVTIAAGRYQQPAPLVFGAQDGGDSASAAVSWRGSGAVLSFGTLIGNNSSDRRWTRVPAAEHLWQYTLAPNAMHAGATPRQLWEVASGDRMTRAREPNTGQNFQIPLAGGLAGNSGFIYKDGDLNRQYSNLTEVELIVYASWSASRHYIQQLNTSSAGGRNLTVTLTAGCLNPPAGMWPNSGNRYYIENDRTFVDAPGEFHISSSGVVTLFPPAAVSDPNSHEWAIDRGDSLKTALQLKDSTRSLPTTLLHEFTGGSQPIVRPADELTLSSDAWNVSFGLEAARGSTGGIVHRGPSAHVPGDLSLSVVAGGTIVLDIGWECTLVGIRRVDDNKKHQIDIRYAQKALHLFIDGMVDASVEHTIGLSSEPTWSLTLGNGLSAGAKLVNLTTTQLTSSAVRHMVFEDLVVEHVGWGLGRFEAADFQSSSFLDTAAVHLHNTSNVLLQNITIRHAGGYALWVEGSSNSVEVTGAHIYDVSGGIRIGRGSPLSAEPPNARTGQISILNSKISGGALVYREAAGVLVQHADAITLSHCEVSFFNHVAVSFGWVWGFHPQSGRDNVIEFNHVHHVGNKDLSDLGGIYMLGVQPNSVVRGNVVHDSDPYFMYGHGIYLDEGGSGIQITQNWVYNTFAALYMQHYGVNNSVTSNVWANASGECLTFDTADGTTDTYCPGHLWHCAYRFQECSFEFSSNILLAGPKDNTFWHQPAEGYCNTTTSRNLYWNQSGPALSATFPSIHQPTCPGYACNLHSLAVNATLSQWQSRGHETGTLVKDPLFVDAARGDFNLRSGSPALDLGFEPLDLTRGVGPDW